MATTSPCATSVVRLSGVIAKSYAPALLKRPPVRIALPGLPSAVLTGVTVDSSVTSALTASAMGPAVPYLMVLAGADYRRSPGSRAIERLSKQNAWARGLKGCE